MEAIASDPVGKSPQASPNVVPMRLLPAALAAGSLIGGYAVARSTKKRQLGGLVLAAGAGAATVMWWQQAGPVKAISALTIVVGAFGASHPLAKQVGAWPSVLGVAATTAVATFAITGAQD